MENILLLYSHCFIIKGAVRASICDLQRNNVYLIPVVMAELFTDARYLDIPTTLLRIGDENDEIFREYLDLLIKNELAFYCGKEELKHFPKLSEEWLFPAQITHCILDTRHQYDYFDIAFLKQLGQLNCHYIQFRFFCIVTLVYLDQLLSLIVPSGIKSVELIMPGQDSKEYEEQIVDFVKKNTKIGNLILYGMGEDSLLKEGGNGSGFVFKTKDNFDGAYHCGQVDTELFSINILTFTEALKYNTCLNRKLSIDAAGYIKNCPSMTESFGHIKDTTLAEALAQPGFKKHWDTGKDEIAVCRDCEFRYICTDCRAYIEEPGNDKSKPLKCGYDPYTATWSEWSQSPLKQQAIQYYHLPR